MSCPELTFNEKTPSDHEAMLKVFKNLPPCKRKEVEITAKIGLSSMTKKTKTWKNCQDYDMISKAFHTVRKRLTCNINEIRQNATTNVSQFNVIEMDSDVNCGEIDIGMKNVANVVLTSTFNSDQQQGIAAQVTNDLQQAFKKITNKKKLARGTSTKGKITTGNADSGTRSLELMTKTVKEGSMETNIKKKIQDINIKISQYNKLKMKGTITAKGKCSINLENRLDLVSNAVMNVALDTLSKSEGVRMMEKHMQKQYKDNPEPPTQFSMVGYGVICVIVFAIIIILFSCCIVSLVMLKKK